MKVQFEKGRASWPLSAFVGLLITILLAGSGFAWAFAQTMANADHKVFLQRLQADEEEASRNEAVTVANTFAVNDIKVEIANRLTKIESTLAQIASKP